jgi:hypothetical protein
MPKLNPIIALADISGGVSPPWFGALEVMDIDGRDKVRKLFMTEKGSELQPPVSRKRVV